MVDEVKIVLNDFNSATKFNEIVLRGRCSFCGDRVTFRRRSYNLPVNADKGLMAAVQCEGCNAVMSYCIKENKLYPAPQVSGLTELPDEIQRYYDESLKCIAADSPNGAATSFRKVIHALGIHYELAEVDDNKSLFTIINELHDDGHIVKKIRDALLGIKDIGNDGAHINANEPDIEQAMKIKELIDVVLNATVLCDKHLDFVKAKHSGADSSK